MRDSAERRGALVTDDPLEIEVILSGVAQDSDVYLDLQELPGRDAHTELSKFAPLQFAIWRRIHEQSMPNPDVLTIDPDELDIAASSCRNVIALSQRFKEKQQRGVARGVLEAVTNMQRQLADEHVMASDTAFPDLDERVLASWQDIDAQLAILRALDSESQ